VTDFHRAEGLIRRPSARFDTGLWTRQRVPHGYQSGVTDWAAYDPSRVTWPVESVGSYRSDYDPFRETIHERHPSFVSSRGRLELIAAIVKFRVE
jgi:hypothetical protein